MELAVAMSRREREAVGLLPADRALQLRRALGLHVGLEPLEHLGAEAAAAALGRDADIRPPAVLATTEHAAIRRARGRDDRAGGVLRHEDESVRLRVRGFEPAGEVDAPGPARAALPSFGIEEAVGSP